MTTGLKPGVHCIAAIPILLDESLDLCSIGSHAGRYAPALLSDLMESVSMGVAS
jgi:hypothetical protein